MDCSPPGSSVRGILQARILEGVFPPSEDLPDPVIQPVSPDLTGRFLTCSSPGKPNVRYKLSIQKRKTKDLVLLLAHQKVVLLECGKE